MTFELALDLVTLAASLTNLAVTLRVWRRVRRGAA